MASNETQRQRVTRIADELGTTLRRLARDRWKGVRTAERNAQGRHVWRFRTGPDGGERFLHIEHGAMVQGTDPAARLLEQLETGRWLDRLHQGPETALVLSGDGELTPLTRS